MPRNFQDPEKAREAGRRGGRNKAALQADGRLRDWASRAGQTTARRQRENMRILRGVAVGLSNRAIAAELQLTEGLVQKRLTRLLAQAHAPNRETLARWYRRVMVPDPEPVLTEALGPQAERHLVSRVDEAQVFVWRVAARFCGKATSDRNIGITARRLDLDEATVRWALAMQQLENERC